MNRYSATPISLSGSGALWDLRVSAEFKTGDNLSFARAVAKLHALQLQDLPDRLALSSP